MCVWDDSTTCETKPVYISDQTGSEKLSVAMLVENPPSACANLKEYEL